MHYTGNMDLIENTYANMKGKRKNILLVEDERIIALSEKQILEKNGFFVKIAYSGKMSIELIANGFLPQAILMDIDLGRGMDGAETSRYILSRWEFPIIFLTSHDLDEIIDKTLGIDNYGYLTKNSAEKTIGAVINSAIESFRNKKRIFK